MARMPENYVLSLAARQRQRPNKVGVMIGMDSYAWEKQVLFIGSHTDVPIAAEACDWWKGDTTALRRKLANTGHVCGHGVAKAKGVEGEGEREHHREQTTWIMGLKGQPDRVDLNNSEQKTASLLTSPLLHFHWQRSNKHMLSSKTFKRSFSSGFSTEGIFFSYPDQWKGKED